MADRIKKAVILSVLAVCAAISLGSARSQSGQGQQQANNLFSRWRPTQDYSGIGYVGSQVCARCHSAQAGQLDTPMAHAMRAAADCNILSMNARLTFRIGPFTYQITRQGDRSIYSVSDGVNTISEPILFCFGKGEAGQTYLFQRNGLYYESRVSYYPRLQNLDITTQHPRSVPASLEEALGRPMTQEAAKGCFACHSTGATGGSEFRVESLSPGVRCEACHGPGERHVAAVRVKDPKDLQIFNPKRLDALDQTQEFCGACHQSFDTVMLLQDRGGINNVRFQPYRMANSPGHLINDSRMSCVACHDPHGRMERDAAYYDSKCLSCHVSSPKEPKTEARQASGCPESSRQCVTCHMPKVEVPDLHYKFTDHWIRIVKPGEPVPR
ncbi:MAG TPA: multiheme c-type cytochrome [Blastocatellia bacterium]|nr:multiheme c-type cytochrome [Blastocatellia bacterium]